LSFANGSDSSIDACPSWCVIPGQQIDVGPIIWTYPESRPGVMTMFIDNANATFPITALPSASISGPPYNFTLHFAPASSLPTDAYFYDFYFTFVPSDGTQGYTTLKTQENIETACSLNMATCPQVQIFDNNLGRVVAASPAPTNPPTTVVGWGQNLVAQWTQGSGRTGITYNFSSQNAPQWQIDGPAVLSYDITTGQSPVPYPSPGVVAAPQPFYWITTNESVPYARHIAVTGISLQGAVSANYTEVTAQNPISGSYNVSAPSNVSLAPSSFGTVTIGPYATVNGVAQYLMELGAGKGKPGIVYNFTAKAPTVGSGWYSGVQTVNSQTTRTTSTGSVTLSGTGGVTELDACPLYGKAAQVSAGKWHSSDQPSVTLAKQFVSATTTQTFQMFLMYKPDDSARSSIWVPLGVLDWNWQGQASRPNTAGTWTLSNPIAEFSPETSIGYPTWNGTYNSQGTNCPAIP
jgi:hypothetical protein